MRRIAITLVLAGTLAIAQEHTPPSHSTPNQEATAEESGHGGIPHAVWWKTANFLILAGILGYFLVTKGGAYFRGRTAEIRKDLEDASRARAEAEASAAEVDRKMQLLGAEVDALRRTSREEIAKEGERIQRETTQQLAKVQAHAEQEILSAAKEARQELKAYAAELALRLAEEQIRQRLNPDSQAALVDAFIADLGREASTRSDAGVH